MIEIPLRGGVLKIVRWLNENEFYGEWEGRHDDEASAMYGWTKGAGYFIYTIDNGHIERIGTVKRDVIDSKRLAC